jgi:hypothetical protein
MVSAAPCQSPSLFDGRISIHQMIYGVAAPMASVPSTPSPNSQHTTGPVLSVSEARFTFAATHHDDVCRSSVASVIDDDAVLEDGDEKAKIRAVFRAPLGPSTFPYRYHGMRLPLTSPVRRAAFPTRPPKVVVAPKDVASVQIPFAPYPSPMTMPPPHRPALAKDKLPSIVVHQPVIVVPTLTPPVAVPPITPPPLIVQPITPAPPVPVPWIFAAPHVVPPIFSAPLVQPVTSAPPAIMQWIFAAPPVVQPTFAAPPVVVPAPPPPVIVPVPTHFASRSAISKKVCFIQDKEIITTTPASHHQHQHNPTSLPLLGPILYRSSHGAWTVDRKLIQQSDDNAELLDFYERDYGGVKPLYIHPSDENYIAKTQRYRERAGRVWSRRTKIDVVDILTLKTNLRHQLKPDTVPLVCVPTSEVYKKKYARLRKEWEFHMTLRGTEQERPRFEFPPIPMKVDS